MKDFFDLQRFATWTLSGTVSGSNAVYVLKKGTTEYSVSYTLSEGGEWKSSGDDRLSTLLSNITDGDTVSIESNLKLVVGLNPKENGKAFNLSISDGVVVDCIERIAMYGAGSANSLTLTLGKGAKITDTSGTKSGASLIQFYGSTASTLEIKGSGSIIRTNAGNPVGSGCAVLIGSGNDKSEMKLVVSDTVYIESNVSAIGQVISNQNATDITIGEKASIVGGEMGIQGGRGTGSDLVIAGLVSASSTAVGVHNGSLSVASTAVITGGSETAGASTYIGSSGDEGYPWVNGIMNTGIELTPVTGGKVSASIYGGSISGGIAYGSPSHADANGTYSGAWVFGGDASFSVLGGSFVDGIHFFGSGANDVANVYAGIWSLTQDASVTAANGVTFAGGSASAAVLEITPNSTTSPTGVSSISVKEGSIVATLTKSGTTNALVSNGVQYVLDGDASTAGASAVTL